MSRILEYGDSPDTVAFNAINPPAARRRTARTRVIYNRLLGGWYIVVGPHHTPISGRFPTKAAALAALGVRTDCRNCGGDGFTVDSPVCPACQGRGRS